MKAEQIARESLALGLRCMSKKYGPSPAYIAHVDANHATICKAYLDAAEKLREIAEYCSRINVSVWRHGINEILNRETP